MRTTNCILRTIICLFAVFIISFSVFGLAITAVASTVTTDETKYEIAVAFDNSGSMYYDSKAWCRAKYAMEIFASMLNYDNGDVLKIFPMWDVTTDGSKPSSGGSHSAITITSKKDIDKISNLYTVYPLDTPLAPVTEAYKDLKSQSDEFDKWLIVLTDGDFNQSDRGTATSIDLRSELLKLSSKRIKVQYLGIGQAKTIKPDESKHLYAMKSSETSLKDDLISICNNIFQRSVLPSNCLSEKKLQLDISMKNLIVFVQGNDAKISSLKDPDGNNVEVTLDSGQRKYSTISSGGNQNAQTDRTLAGQVVSFDACKKGEYVLEYSKADKIQVFYEPDIDIAVNMTNSDGATVDPTTDGVSAGEYKVAYSLIDSVTKEDVSNSPLLGKDVKLNGSVIDSKGNKTEVKNGDKVELMPDDETFLDVEGTYLKRYRITTTDNKSAYSFKVDFPESDGLDVQASCLQSSSWYCLKDHDNWKPIKAVVTLNGQKLTDDQMTKVDFSITTSTDLLFAYETVPGESAIEITVAEDETGNYVEPMCANYHMKIEGTALDEYDQEFTDSDEVSFDIQWYSVFWTWLIKIVILLLILLILALIAFLLHKIKVLPNRVVAENTESRYHGKQGGANASISQTKKFGLFTESGVISVRSTIGSLGISLNVKPDHPLFKPLFVFQKSSRRYYRIVQISSPPNTSVMINGTLYKDDDQRQIKLRVKNPSIEAIRGAGDNKASLKCTISNR